MAATLRRWVREAYFYVADDAGRIRFVIGNRAVAERDLAADLAPYRGVGA
jgi:hypothetical protein